MHQARKKIPQRIPETGISADYGNHWAGKAITLRYSGLLGVMQAVREYPIPLYTDAYHPDTFEDAVTEANATRVHALNDLARVVNQAAQDGCLCERVARSAIRKADELIYGKNERWLVS